VSDLNRISNIAHFRIADLWIILKYAHDKDANENTPANPAIFNNILSETVEEAKRQGIGKNMVLEELLSATIAIEEKWPND
jgi:hypothetical protein